MLRKLVYFAIISVIVLSSTHLLAQDKFLYNFQKIEQPQDVPHFEVALANTASDSINLSQFWIFVKVINDELQFIKSKGKKFRADYEISVTILDTTGIEIESKKSAEFIIANNFDDVNSVDLFRVTNIQLDLPPEKYLFKILLKDLETRRVGRQEGSVTLRDFSKTDVMISDVLFLDSSNREKNQVEEPTLDDSNGQRKDSTLYAYFEIYNIPEKESIRINYQILNIDKEVIMSGADTTISTGRITRNYIELAQNELFGGNNRIKLTVAGNAKSLVLEQLISRFRESSFTDFTNLKEAIEKLVYIAKNDEWKTLRKAKGEKEQEKEFKKFWEKRDPTPGTPRNEYLDEYYRRVEIANKNFSENKEGWRTDMGMVYIKLGAPDYIDKPIGYNDYYDPTSFTRPPIVWQYNDISRRIIFYYRGGEYRIANYNEVFSLLNGEMRF